MQRHLTVSSEEESRVPFLYPFIREAAGGTSIGLPCRRIRRVCLRRKTPDAHRCTFFMHESSGSMREKAVQEERPEGPIRQGTIIKGISGFYYVAVEDADSGDRQEDLPANLVPRKGMRIYQCRARGIFRKEKKKPLVGDQVLLTVLSEEEQEANLVEILPRKNALIRPAAANVDQALVFFALQEPEPDASLLDRFLILMQRQGVPVILCLNKKDLADPETAERWRQVYQACGYQVLVISASFWVRQKQAGQSGYQQDEDPDLRTLRNLLRGKTTVIAGPSGVGKSTLTNVLQDTVTMETGGISRKLHKGKNTTRHAELVPLGQHTFFCDTPGFASLDLPEMEKEELWKCFPEFAPYEKFCRFQGCSHVTEPDCGIREAVSAGKIPEERYENYCRFYRELQEREKQKYS